MLWASPTASFGSRSDWLRRLEFIDLPIEEVIKKGDAQLRVSVRRAYSILTFLVDRLTAE